jgi:large subunit ribosomal protein L35Ae
MKGRISNYRMGVHTSRTNQFVVKVDGVDDRSTANGIVGKKVSYKPSEGKAIVGKVSKAHGNSGAVLCRFERGLPGQAVGAEVEVA